MKKRSILLSAILVIIFLANLGYTHERGETWEKLNNTEGSSSIIISNGQRYYFNGSSYESFNYGPCGDTCFRDGNGLIYKVNNISRKALVDIYKIDGTHLSSLGFAVT